MTEFEAVLRTLQEGGVEFILVGGVAASAHGSVRFTADIDVVYRRSPANHQRMAKSLQPLQPYLRGAPKGLPFRWDAETIAMGLNFTLTTTLGDVDLLGEIVGGGTYEELESHCVRLDIFGHHCLVLDLDTLIHVKRAAGRVKDLEAIAELEALREERRASE